MRDSPVLSVEGLTVGFRTSDRKVLDVVRDVSLEIVSGESLGIVGETGCGKSTLAGALLGYLRPGSVRVAGAVRFDGIDLFGRTRSEHEPLRGSRLAVVPQNSGQSLTPTMRVGDQVAETVRRHRGLGRAAAGAEVIRLFQQVRLPAPSAIARRYPHELSGGQQQRVAIAIALAGRPELIVLDEPTTGLDVTTQAHILDLMEQIREEVGCALVYVSHDLGVIARVSERLLVMYAGEVVELGSSADLFTDPRHPYSVGLLRAVPRLSSGALPSGLAGAPPVPGAPRRGCTFTPRCPFADSTCQMLEPNLHEVPARAARHEVRCHHWERVSLDSQEAAPCRERAASAAESRVPLLEVRDLAISYATTSFGRRVMRALRRSTDSVSPPSTVADIGLAVRRGEILALVGESGSGKSTIARVIAGLQPAAAGELRFAGEDLTTRVVHRSRPLRRRIQLIFQNPDSSLNPRQSVAAIIERPLRFFFGYGRRERRQRALALLEEVGLSYPHLDRFPGQLSGGERQRVAIARAFSAQPELLLCDEIVSALDVSVQATVLQLLETLRTERNVTYLFISHDLAVVRAIADRVAVLYLGRLCEVGTTAEVYEPPFHPYTEALLSAVLEPVPGSRRRVLVKEAEPEATAPAQGCPFQHRCPRHLGPVCDEVAPPWRVTASGHALRCHMELDELIRLQTVDRKEVMA